MRQSPNSKKNVTPQIIDNPSGVDIVVKELQLALSAALPWLTKSFNRAVMRSKLDSNSDEMLFPACWIDQGKDEYNMIGNDNWDSYSFFYATGGDSIIDYNQSDDTSLERDLSLYLWLKPSKIDDTKGQGELIEFIKGEVIQIIKSVDYSIGGIGVDIISIEDIPTEVFNEFTIDTTTTQSLYYPYAAIRFDLAAQFTYELGC